jgi:hypothetical protein
MFLSWIADWSSGVIGIELRVTCCTFPILSPFVNDQWSFVDPSSQWLMTTTSASCLLSSLVARLSSCILVGFSQSYLFTKGGSYAP